MTRLLPLFLISAAAVGFEIALTRYFAVSKWSEYGYWVISIVMAGFALSGVAMAIARDWAVRHGAWLIQALPPVLVLTAALGYYGVTVNPFNPLQLQNVATYVPELGNIALYYAVLLPFFFLAGFYISLVFVLNAGRIGRVYGFDLTGAGFGAAVVLLSMNFLHPFQLAPALLVLLTAGSWAGRQWRPALAAAVALAAGLTLLLADPQAAYNDFKAIYAPLHVPDARQVAEIRSPRGIYALLSDFTERLDTDVSNDAGQLGVSGPPQTLGLYRDGARVAALPEHIAQADYAPAALAALPYVLRPPERTLLAGISGGYGIAQALVLGAREVDALEPDPVLLAAVRDGLGPVPAMTANPQVHLSSDSPLAAARAGGPYDLIDIAGDFLDAGEANASAYTVEAIEADLRALAPGGLVSIPVSIREFPVYAIRVLGAAREALGRAGIADPARHVVVYRSAWNVRILLSPAAWSDDAIATIRAWCAERSFDVSYFPGIDVVAARADIYNDLPAVSFESGQVTSGAGSEDAVADEAGAVLRGEPSASQDAFNLTPATLDRPAFYAVLRLSHLGTILQRLEILPQAEVGQLVNLAVLAQAALLALFVLVVPWAAPRIAGARAGLLRTAVYFASLGLGFLFIEIVLIERASLYLNDRTSAFAIVLTGMLVFSGVGSLMAERLPGRALAWATLVIIGWCSAMLIGVQPAMLATLDLPWAVRAGLLLLIIAPVSVALGLPFPLGLARAGASGGAVLPWAWALNGAFSVVATPLANIVAVQGGFARVLALAGLLYALMFAVSPSSRKSLSWQTAPLT